MIHPAPSLSDVDIPDVDIPDVDIPDIDIPDIDVPGTVTSAIRRHVPSISASGYRRVLALALFLVSLIIFTGALVRLSGSGLGCPQWPTCSVGQILRAPNNHGRIELFNRYLTGWIGAIVVVLGLTSVVRRPYRKALVRLSLLLLVGVVGQALLGGLTVILKLKPQAVMGHFLLSIALLSAALVLHDRAAVDTDRPLALSVRRTDSWLARALALFGVLTVFAGTIVTSSGPHGGDEIAERFAFSMRDVARLHSLAAWLLVATVVGLALRFRLARSAGERRLQRRIGQLLAATLVQGAIGYTQYLTQVPAWLVAVHILGVIAVWCTALRVALPLWRATPSSAPTASSAPSWSRPTGAAATPAA